MEKISILEAMERGNRLAMQFNRLVEMVQESVSAEERYEPSELAERVVHRTCMYREENVLMHLQKLYAEMTFAYQKLLQDMRGGQGICMMVRAFVKTDQSLPSMTRKDIVSGAIMNFAGILQMMNNLVKQAEREDCMPLVQTVSPSEERVTLPCPETKMRPQIYMPEPQNNQRFCVQTETDAEKVAEIIASSVCIRVFRDELYVLMDYPKRFRKMVGKEPQVFIDEFVRKRQIKVKPQEYDDVKKCLLYNSTIWVYEKTELPPFLWAFADGLVDIRDGRRVENLGDFFYTTALKIPYVPGAQCPTFDQFLLSAAGGNENFVESMWRIIGYILSNDTSWKAFFVFLGAKDTGKSLLANVISALLEDDAVASLGISEFGKKFTVAELVDKKLALCMDLTDEPISPVAVGTIKTITGGDLARAEPKYQTGRPVRIKAKLLFGTNHPLSIKQADSAFLERQVLIPFLYPVPKEQQDKNLKEKLLQEAAGIAFKAAAAYLRLVADNYTVPTILAEIPTGIVIDNAKVLQGFIAECCDFENETAQISTQELHRAYLTYCGEHNLPTMEKNDFSAAFKKENPKLIKKKLNASENGFVGVQLKFR